MQNITHNTATSPTIKQAIDLMQSLPPTEQKSALDYIRYLVSEYGSSSPKQDALTPKRQPGTLKGDVIFADDFDEPLEDFKDYMV